MYVMWLVISTGTKKKEISVPPAASQSSVYHANANNANTPYPMPMSMLRNGWTTATYESLASVASRIHLLSLARDAHTGWMLF